MKNMVFVLFVVISFFAVIQSEAQTLTVLHDFGATNGGFYPNDDLTLSGSVIYGTTRGSGSDDGSVYSIPVSGGTLKTLYKFKGDMYDEPSAPTGGVRLSNDGSTLYGMSTWGGSKVYGTIFSLPAAGGTPTVLYNFSNQTEGPRGNIILSKDGSTLYGTLPDDGMGSIFRIPVTGGTLTDLCAFPGGYQGAYDPTGSLTLSSDGSTLYGMTEMGGTVSGYGTIFSVALPSGTKKTLYAFSGDFSARPTGGVTLSGSTLYGMQPYGPTPSPGEIFSLPVSGGTPTKLFNFDYTHGSRPLGSLTISQDGSTLYGMTSSGGSNNLGTIFKIPVTGGTPTVLFNFDGIHGKSPKGTLTLSADGMTLYGVTESGGAYGYGEIFALTIPEPSTLALLGMSAFGLLAWAWRRNRKG